VSEPIGGNAGLFLALPLVDTRLTHDEGDKGQCLSGIFDIVEETLAVLISYIS
jgi:hypothetical protein